MSDDFRGAGNPTCTKSFLNKSQKFTCTGSGLTLHKLWKGGQLNQNGKKRNNSNKSGVSNIRPLGTI